MASALSWANAGVVSKFEAGKKQGCSVMSRRVQSIIGFERLS
jgi:hypothetical protein